VLAVAVDKGKHVRVSHASPLIARMLRLTNLDHFLDLNSGSGPQLVRSEQRAIA
jgi:hypothetical protein